MHEKVCIITGGNSGIGKEAAIELARLGAHVAIVARDEKRGEAAVDRIRRTAASSSVSLLLADLSSQAEVRRLAKVIDETFPRVDVLLNNAGLTLGERRVTVDGIETTFAVNHLAYFLLTNLLLHKLVESAPSRIVNVSSDAHRSGTIDFDDLQYERDYSGWRAYAQSKLANVLFTYELARRLEGTGVTANCLHPGVVATNFANEGGFFMKTVFRLFAPFLTTPAKGARTSIYLASSPEVEGVSGQYFVKSRPVPSSAESRDREVAQRLWEVSEQLVAAEPPAEAGLSHSSG